MLELGKIVTRVYKPGRTSRKEHKIFLKKSYDLTGKTSEGFLEEVGLGLSLK